MVATRGQGRKRAADQEPPISAYERRRNERVASNQKMLEALGLLNLATDLNNYLPQSATKKGKNSGNKKSNSHDSDSSEYLLGDDDQGDSDDDDTESDEVPEPIAIQLPEEYIPPIHTAKKRKTNPKMPPGGRTTKRVRASEGSQLQTQRRQSKRLQTSVRDGQSVQDSGDAHYDRAEWSHTFADEDSANHGASTDEGNGATGQDNIFFAQEDNAAANDSTGADEDNVAVEENSADPAQRAPRKPRPPTKGTLLDRMTKAMGGRMPIAVAEGKRRPHEPVQAAKFASESGVIIRDKMPILPRWKDYKDNEQYYEEFVSKLSGRLAINENDGPTKEAVNDMLRSGVRQMRYRLKKKYFNGKPANQIPTTSPVQCMTDEEWRSLVAKWTNPKNMETCEKNKHNRSRVKYHQATGSRSYVAHLHAYKQRRNNAEPSTEQNEDLDVVEAFQTCHTSSKHGLSEAAREALSNMEALRNEPAAEGEARIPSVQVVSQVLPKNSTNIFLKNVGIKPAASSKSSSITESELREQLAAEAKAAVQGELEDLKKRSEQAEEKLARTQQELEEYKKITEINSKALQENNALLNRMLSINRGPST